MKKYSDKMKKGVYRFTIKNGKNASFPKDANFPKGNSENEENDINLMMIFGMEKEARYKNPEKYNKLRRDAEKNQKANGKQEYLSKEQNGEFNTAYSKKYKSIRIKLVLSFLLFIACAAFEYVIYQTALVQEILLMYSPVIIALFALQLLLVCIALGYKQYFSGFGFNSGKGMAGVVFTVLSTACVAYYTVLCIMLGSGKAVLQGGSISNFYLSVVAFCLLLSMVEELNHAKREWKSFLTVSDEKSEVKYTLDKNSKGSGKRFSGSDRKRSLSVKKTKFISGFVSRCGQRIVKRSSFNVLVTISVIASLALSVYRYAVTRELLSAFSALITSLVFTLPFSAFLTFSLGFKKAVDNASVKGGTIIGLRTFEELQSVSAVYFDDIAVFPPSGVRLKGFKSYGNSRIDHLLYLIASVYKKIDAPPAKLFIDSVGEENLSGSVDIIDLSASGIHAVVDGKPLYIGGGDYMTECGFAIPEGREETQNPNICITYMAMSGLVVMKLFIEYSMDKKMLSHIESLRKYGIYLGICTCDPSINDGMMNRRISLAKYPVGILKSLEDKAEGKISEEISSGIVSNRGTGSLLSTLLLCINTAHFVKIDMIVKYFSLAAGILISFLVTFFAVEGHINSWFLILYQFFWLIPSYLIAKLGTRS